MAKSQAGAPQAGPTPRRSSRIASNAGSVAGSQVESNVAGTGATPSRSGVRRRGRLPTVKSRQSQAYGASGRLGAAEQMNVSATGFAQAFDQHRDNAVDRDDFEDSDEESYHESLHQESLYEDRGSPSPSEASLTPRLKSQPQHRHSEFDIEHNSSNISNSDTSKSFGMYREAGMTATASTRANGLAQGPSVSSFIRAPPTISQASQAAGPNGRLGATAAHTSSAVPGPRSFPAAQRPDQIFQANGDAPIVFARPNRPSRGWAQRILVFFGIIIGVIVALMFAEEASQTRIFGPASHRIDHAYNKVVNWIRPPYQPSEQSVEAMRQAIENLKDTLPPLVIVRYGADGEPEIPEEFWRALFSKAKAASEGRKDPAWNDFEDWHHQKSVEIVRGHISHLGLVRLDQLIDILNQRYKDVAKLIDGKLAENAKQMKVIAQDAARKEFLDRKRLESFAVANLIASAEVNMRKINHFSTGLGARVDPWKTSSTYVAKESYLTTFYRRFFTHQRRHSPIVALQKWDEPGDCWCAAPDDKDRGLVQLSVGLGHEMFPDQVTIEHLPKEASLDYTTAPKDIELWAKTNEQVESFSECGLGPRGFVCLGKFKYNIHGPTHTQTFNLDINLREPVTKTLLRVTDNWGADHTCIYRVRLHGSPAKKID